MLPVLKPIPMEFHSADAALGYLERRVLRRLTLPLRDLRVDATGRLSAAGARLEDVRQIPLTDVALRHLEALAGMPRAYCARIEADLHQHSPNELLQRQVGAATVAVESEVGSPAEERVAAVLPGARFGVDDVAILQRIAARGLAASIAMGSGYMELHFGETASVQVLPAEHMQLVGILRNAHWGLTKLATRPVLEVSLYVLRLVCSNGAYARRVLAEGRLMAWATREQIARFLDHQVDRVLSFQQCTLAQAVETMRATIPEEAERAEVVRLIARFAGARGSKAALSAVSWWDHFNAVTAAANQLGNVERRRHLQIEGGRILERFLA